MPSAAAAEGRLMEAEALCRRVLEAQPNLPEAAHLLGVIAHQNGKLGEAIEHVKRATKLAPQSRAVSRQSRRDVSPGRPAQAGVEAGRRALAIEPDYAGRAEQSRRRALRAEGLRGSRARATARRSPPIPNFAEAHCNLGNALHALEALRRGDRRPIAAPSRSIPNYADGWANLGTTLHHNGVYRRRRWRSCAAPSRSRRDHANAHSGLGILLLMHGDFAEGWDEYEWRLRSTERKGPRFPERPWQGESLAGKHIYVQAEQGFGDTLQFARYIPLLAARARQGHAARASAARQPDAREPARHRRSRRSRRSGALSLRRRADEPAASVQDAARDHPRRRALSARARSRDRDAGRSGSRRCKGCKIGIVWAGNPDHVERMRRSLDCRDAGAAVCTCRARPSRACNSARARPISRSSKAQNADRGSVAGTSSDFADTAARDQRARSRHHGRHFRRASCRRAGQAGMGADAVGRPIGAGCLDREDNPWYPTMRLFRQTEGRGPGRRHRARGAGAESRGGGRRRAADAVQGRRRAPRRRGRGDPRGRSRAGAARPQSAAASSTPGQALLLAEQKRRHGFLGRCRRALPRAQPKPSRTMPKPSICSASSRISRASSPKRSSICAAPSRSRRT